MEIKHDLKTSDISLQKKDLQMDLNQLCNGLIRCIHIYIYVFEIIQPHIIFLKYNLEVGEISL